MASPGASPQRRRLLALGVLALALFAVVVVVASGGSSTHHPRRGAHVARRTRPAAEASASVAVRRRPGTPGPPRPVPILMYHVISAPFANSPYPDLYVPKEQFADQMRALDQAGYTAVTLQQVWDSWHAHGPLPRRPLVVSFDDGYRSHYRNALPVLRALGWPGVLNLELKNIRPDYGLTDVQVRALIAAGWEVDSHTIDHPDLRTVDGTRLRHELVDSRAEIKRRFGVPANFFCYPAGRYDDAVVAAVRQAGYLAATTTNPGLAQPAQADRFVLNRVRVNNGVSGASLVSQLAGLGA